MSGRSSNSRSLKTIGLLIAAIACAAAVVVVPEVREFLRLDKSDNASVPVLTPTSQPSDEIGKNAVSPATLIPTPLPSEIAAMRPTATRTIADLATSKSSESTTPLVQLTATVLSNGQPGIEPMITHSGVIADDAYNDYAFQGYANTPVLFTIERTDGDLCYYVYMFDSEDEQLTRWGSYCGGRQKLHFTPQRDEALTLRVLGSGSYGSYTISADWIDTPPEQRNPKPTLAVGTAHSGVIADDAYNDYAFQGYANTPVLFTIERTDGDLCYYVYMFDSEDEQLTRWGSYCGGRQKLHFTPQRDEALTLRVLGSGSYGSYTISADNLK